MGRGLGRQKKEINGSGQLPAKNETPPFSAESVLRYGTAPATVKCARRGSTVSERRHGPVPPDSCVQIRDKSVNAPANAFPRIRHEKNQPTPDTGTKASEFFAMLVTCSVDVG